MIVWKCRESDQNGFYARESPGINVGAIEKCAERGRVKGGALKVPPAVSFSINFFLCVLSAIIV